MASSAAPRAGRKKCIAMPRISAVHNASLGEGRLGVSESRCLGRCENGPVVVVYPDNVWYQYIDEEDIDEILESHLEGGNIVDRLLIK